MNSLQRNWMKRKSWSTLCISSIKLKNRLVFLNHFMSGNTIFVNNHNRYFGCNRDFSTYLIIKFKKWIKNVLSWPNSFRFVPVLTRYLIRLSFHFKNRFFVAEAGKQREDMFWVFRTSRNCCICTQHSWTIVYSNQQKLWSLLPLSRVSCIVC